MTELAPRYGCPIALISRLINKDEKEVSPFGVLIQGTFKDPIAKNCMNQLPRFLKEPVDLESFFAAHPMTRIPGVPKDFISKCLDNPAELRRARVNRPLTNAEKSQLISDWYLTMNRLRRGLRNTTKVIQHANAGLGKKPNEGINAPGSHVPGATEFTQGLESCPANGMVVASLANRLRQTMMHLDDEAKKKYPDCATACQPLLDAPSPSEKRMSLVQAKISVLQDGTLTPLGNEPAIRPIMERILNGEQVPQSKVEEAYRQAFAGMRASGQKKLSEIERAARCLESTDENCFSGGPPIQDVILLRAQPNAQEVLQDMPEFDLDAFLASIREGKDSLTQSHNGKRKGIEVFGYLNSAECMAAHRAGFDTARSTENDFASGVALNVATAGLGLWIDGLQAGLLTLKTNQLLARFPALAKQLNLPSKLTRSSNSLIQPKVFGSTARTLNQVRFGTQIYWTAFGMHTALQTCKPIAEAAQAKIKEVKSKGCERDVSSELITLGDWAACITSSFWAASPAIMRAAANNPAVQRYMKTLTDRWNPLSTEIQIRPNPATLHARTDFDPKASLTPEEIMASNNPYQILGVPAGTNDLASLKRAFRNRVRTYHPDVHAGDKRYEESLKKITEAANVLGVFPSK